MRTREQKIEAAVESLNSGPRSEHLSEALRRVFGELLDDKFDEEPLPEIKPLGKAWHPPCLNNPPGEYYVRSYQAMVGFGAVHGPTRSTAREAIEAWNAGVSHD
jgi:hypothetical protein